MSKSKKSDLPVEFLERMARVLRLLAHAHRLQIVELLEDEELPVNAIVEHLGLPQATVSQHLIAMRRVGIVESKRNGREVIYSIADKSSIKILNCIRCRRDEL